MDQLWSTNATVATKCRGPSCVHSCQHTDTFHAKKGQSCGTSKQQNSINRRSCSCSHKLKFRADERETHSQVQSPFMHSLDPPHFPIQSQKERELHLEWTSSLVLTRPGSVAVKASPKSRTQQTRILRWIMTTIVAAAIGQRKLRGQLRAIRVTVFTKTSRRKLWLRNALSYENKWLSCKVD